MDEPEGVLDHVRVDLPPGLVGNPRSVLGCSAADFEGISPRCPGGTQIGVFRGIVTDAGEVNTPVYNLEPTPGSAAVFGISLGGESFLQRLVVVGNGSAGSVRLSGSPPSGSRIVDVEEELWGVPAASGHDPERVCQKAGGGSVQGCPSDAEERPFLTLPASCSEPLRTTVTATSLGPPVLTSVATALSSDAGGNPQALIGCEAVPFDPRIGIANGVRALAPTGLAAEVEVPQYEGVNQTPAATVAGLRLELPEGLALNPAAGSWLAGCPPAAIGLESAPGVRPAVFGGAAATCPASSRLGSVRLQTPLIDHGLTGSIFLATPDENPYGSPYAVYLVVEDEATGTIVKVPGRLDADPASGRLTVAIPEMPPLPFSAMKLEFAGGSRAVLAGPASCGSYAAEATFTPSTAPFASPAQREAPFQVESAAVGNPCPQPEAQRPVATGLQAGAAQPGAGRYSSLAIRLSRSDLDQHFGAFDLTLPPGLTANLGSVPLGSAVGGVRVEAGVGAEPVSLNGSVYLEGPYRGAPYSLSIVVPARAGPFDLGTIAERAAVFVDPVTAQIGVRTDPLPQILEGVPLQLRGLRLDLDRPGFIRNPTSCEPMSVRGTATSSLGQTAPLTDRFQVGDCASLAFRPRLSVRLLGSTARGAHPQVRATLRPGAGSAGIKAAAIALPGSELLDPKRIGAICTLPAAEIERCPRGTEVAHLEVHTPLLAEPLAGPVFLHPSRSRLPGLTAVLHGAVELRLSGQLGSEHGGVRIGFDDLPDLPFDSLSLRVAGGTRGILVNSGGVCRGSRRLTAVLDAQNGRERKLSPRLGAHCSDRARS